MSGRLKRKLADLGVDISSKKANENFCLIGTPLPPLDKRDANEYVPLWKQDVRDEKGRRRLHGAFTGGFSAGYFNTVGSKEGWTPSAFVSSRTDRAKKKAARPEDFMDEEDLQELKDNRKLVSNVDAMDLTGTAQAELTRKAGEEFESDPVKGALLSALLPAPKDSAGARLLRKMGWKPGQGIGPRISYRQRKLEEMRAATKKPLTLADVVITEEEEEAAKHTYPRRDTVVPVFERKDNPYGLGYTPGVSLNESLGRSKKEGETGPNLSAGFGLGALNDAEEDDIDVYDSGYNPGKSRIAFDLSEQDNDTIKLTQKKPKVEQKESRPKATGAMFSIGVPVLPGFVLDDTFGTQDVIYPPPEVPKGWKPDPTRVWNSDPNNENIQALAEKTKQPLAHHQWKTGMTPEERGALLGEEPISTAPVSVFEYMSQKDRDRIQNIATSLAAGPQPAGLSDARIPRTEPHIAEAALKGFQPFISDPVKHERYTAYLLAQADPNAPTPDGPKPLPNQRPEEFNKELEDYAKAAAIFKPMTGAMAGRFISAVVVEHGPKIREGLHTPSTEEIARHEEEEKKRQEEKLTPQQHAAKLGMYGPMTRETRPWQPARLLSKRFGVKEPELKPEAEVGVGVDSDAPAEKSWQEQAGISVPTEQDVPTQDVKRDFNNIGLGEDETQGIDTLTYQVPSMDIFKAIFASDEESGDEGAKEEDEEDEEKQDSVAARFFPDSQNVKEATEVKTEGPVDLTTFKPTFIPRDRKSKSSRDKDRNKGKNGDTGEKGKKDKEKKKKDKKDKKTLVSFEVDDEGGGLSFSSKPSKSKNKDRPKKKRKETEGQGDGNDEAMWEPKMAGDESKLSKLAPSSVPSTIDQGSGTSKTAEHQEEPTVQTTPGTSHVESVDGASGPSTNRGRKRAIDFM